MRESNKNTLLRGHGANSNRLVHLSRSRLVDDQEKEKKEEKHNDGHPFDKTCTHKEKGRSMELFDNRMWPRVTMT